MYGFTTSPQIKTLNSHTVKEKIVTHDGVQKVIEFSFWGEEEILFDGVRVYWLRFHGGEIGVAS